MKTNPTPADPKIKKRMRQNYAAYSSLSTLPGEKDQNYIYQHQTNPTLQVPRLLEFGRPSL